MAKSKNYVIELDKNIRVITNTSALSKIRKECLTLPQMFKICLRKHERKFGIFGVLITLGRMT